MKTSLIHLSRVVLTNTAARAAAVFLALIPFTPYPTQASTLYIGNSTNAPATGAPDGIPPLVILGEYNPSGPLANGLELRSGSIQDVQYYGSNCDFTVYALSLVVSEPNNNEQVFHVDALEHFSANFTNEAVHILQATNFPVTCGELIAFAGIGPFYPNYTVEDQPNFDATYGDAVNTGSGFPSAYQATPPVANQIFTNGVTGDANSTTYDYIPDQFGNQGRYYAIGVDVSVQGVCTSNCISLACPGDIVTNTCSNSIPVSYAAEASDICTSNGSVQFYYDPPPGSLFQLGSTLVTVTAYDYLGNTDLCEFTVTVQPGDCPCTNTTTVIITPGNDLLALPPGNQGTADMLFPNPDPNQLGGPRDGDAIGTYNCGNGINYAVFDSFTSDTSTGFIDGTTGLPVPPPYLAPGCGFIYLNSQGTNEIVVFSNCTSSNQAYCFCGCNQWSFLGSTSTAKTSGYQDITGVAPVNGAAVSFDGPNFDASTDVYSNGVWKPRTPVLTNGYAAFFYVPCPASNSCITLFCSNLVAYTCSNCTQVIFTNTSNASYTCCTNPPVLTFYPPQTYCFPLGTNTVLVTATDSCGDVAMTNFTVTVLPCSTNCYPIFGCVSNPPDLVQNGDFETFSSCPTARVFPPEQPAKQEINLAVGWFSPSLATPDYYNSCAPNSSGMSAPGNSAGYAVPHSGQAYAGAAMYVVDTSNPAQGPNASPTNSYREYIETQLASPLQAGTTYVISFYVFLAAGEGQVGIDNVGAYLSPGALENYTGSYYQTTGAFALTPQVRNPAGNFITSTNNWTLVSGTYTATGGEDYLTIGNFYDNAHTPTTPVNPALYGAQIQAYYFVDDVSVSALCGCPPPKSVDACSPWSFDTPTAYDSCGSNPVSVSILNTATNFTPQEIITRTWLATDGANTATCSQNVTLLQLPPFITYCPSNFAVCIVSNGCGYMPDATSELSASAADGETFVIITQSIPPGTWLCADTTVTFTVSDCFGNVATTNVPVTLLPCTNNCVPPPTNMVLWLPFDETNGILSANLASPPYPGTHVGNPMPLQGQHVANSLVFDGANYVTVPNYPGIEIGTNDLTIDAWVNLANTDSFATNVIVDKGAFGGYALWLTPSWGLQFVTPNGYFSQGTPISAQGWHFVALSFNQTTGKGFFYVDGAVAGNPITMNPVPANLSNTNALWVGASSSFPFNTESAHAWVGALDEVEIFNRALLTNDLNLIYSAGTAGKCKPSCYLQDISISRLSTNSLQITWSGSGILEQTTDLLNGWTVIQNATSPYVTPITTNKTLFFRLECP